MDVVSHITRKNKIFEMKHPALEVIESYREGPYNSKEFRVLGKVYERKGISLPSITKDPKFAFGVATIYGDGIIDWKKLKQPDYDLDEGVAKLYRTSHRKHRVGEPIHHGFDLKEISKLKAKELVQQGRKNRHNENGGAMKDVMIEKIESVTPLVNSRLEAFKERTQPQVGTVHDPMKETISHLSPKHTFGVITKSNQSSFKELIYSQPKGKENALESQTNEKLGEGPKSKGVPKRLLIIHTSTDHDDCEPLTSKIPTSTFGGGEKIFRKNYLKTEPFTALEEDPAFRFGVPSIRSNPPQLQRLTDNTNYGDQASLGGLIAPRAEQLYGEGYANFRKEYLRLVKDGKSPIKVTSGASLVIPKQVIQTDVLGKHIVKGSPFATTSQEGRFRKLDIGKYRATVGVKN
jgi:hypothetical protein